MAQSNPTADRETKVYKIQLSRLRELKNPTMAPREGTIPSAQYREKVPYLETVTISTEAPVSEAGLRLTPPGGVDVSSPKGDSHSMHMHMHEPFASLKDQDPEQPQPQEQHQKQDPLPRRASPSDPPTGTSRPETHGSSASHTKDSAAAPKFPERDRLTLANIFYTATQVEDENDLKSLEAYQGNLSAARLALLMMYAFTISDYWPKAENWWTLDMENFLNVADRKLDKEFQLWRQHDALVKKFPKPEAVLQHVSPCVPVPVQRAIDLGLVDYVGVGVSVRWFAGKSLDDAIATGLTKEKVIQAIASDYDKLTALSILLEQVQGEAPMTVSKAFEIDDEA